MERAARWSSLIAAVAGLLGGVAAEGRDERLAAALFSVGFLLLGVWLVLLIEDGR